MLYAHVNRCLWNENCSKGLTGNPIRTEFLTLMPFQVCARQIYKVFMKISSVYNMISNSKANLTDRCKTDARQSDCMHRCDHTAFHQICNCSPQPLLPYVTNETEKSVPACGYERCPNV